MIMMKTKAMMAIEKKIMKMSMMMIVMTIMIMMKIIVLIGVTDYQVHSYRRFSGPMDRSCVNSRNNIGLKNSVSGRQAHYDEKMIELLCLP